jgi:hypothetical protein
MIASFGRSTSFPVPVSIAPWMLRPSNSLAFDPGLELIFHLGDQCRVDNLRASALSES